MKSTPLLVAALTLITLPSWAASPSEAVHEAVARVQAAGKLPPFLNGKTDSGEACQIDLGASGGSTLLAEVSLTSTNEGPQLQLSDDPNFVIDTLESSPDQLVVKYHEHDPGGWNHTDWGMPVHKGASTKTWSIIVWFHGGKIIAVEAEENGEVLKCNVAR